MPEETLYEEVGTEGRLYYNRRQGWVRLAERSDDLEVFISSDDGRDWDLFELGESVDAPLLHEGALAFKSARAGRREAVLENVSPDGEVRDKLRVRVNAYQLSVDVDADCDGEVGIDEPGKAHWVWGKSQPGAIVLVNNDRDRSDVNSSEVETSELADLLVRPTGLSEVSLKLYAREEDARRFSVYRKDASGKLERILGKAPGSDMSPIMVSPLLSPRGEHCLIEAHEYPSPSFEGLLTIELFSSVGDKLIGRDRVVLRVAPWIMTPNTLPVERVYVCDMTAGVQDETSENEYSNSALIRGLEEACESLGRRDLLKIIPPEESGSDIWIQDEVEFGYSQSPTHTLPVVCDSPRDKGLADFAMSRLRGPDFGHFQIGGNSPNTLDFFGNLEVSPPVTVGKRRYPLGRIVFGGADYRGYGTTPRRMMPELRDFLHAQKVQSPIEIFTDWLDVGHVDEILSFVPTKNEKGFKLLLASPGKAKAILRRLSESGHGDAVMFKGKRRNDVSAEISVDELLSQADLWDANEGFQKLMDLNREILKEGLGLDDADVFAIPVIFFGRGNERSWSFFPNMVNHLVLEFGDPSPRSISIVPKPYGPVVNGEDAFENAFCATVPERDVRFVDDWYSYHQFRGEVHCGTNAQRKPFSDVRWWEHKPEGAYDV
jgi:protein-arginine deiminase